MNFDDNAPAQQVIRFINGTNHSIFLTGRAGTGKTTLLKEIVEHTHKNVVIVAPTGIAAINAGGTTIHSTFQIPPSCFAPALDFAENEIPFAVMPLKKVPKEVSKMSGKKRNVLRQMELLVIDEVSMLRADLLDAIDTALRYIRRSRQPFGGVQVLFLGDMLQLPPVVKNEEWAFLRQYYDSMFFFDAIALRNNPPLILELEHIYRQNDKRFIEILNNLRNNQIQARDIIELNEHYVPNFEPPKQKPYIFITTHNKKADKINEEKLLKLKSKSQFFKATISGNFPENLYPIVYKIELKEGAQIMFLKNDTKGQYYNGKIAIVHKIKGDSITALFPETGQIVEVEKFTWENIRYSLDKSTGQIEEEILGTFTSFPIKLAWAVTVHKSQGLTFERAIIDVSEAFAPGQIYVALSRLQSLKGLILSQEMRGNSPDLSNRVIQFSKTKKDDDELEKIYSVELQRYIELSVLNTFDFSNLHEEYLNHLTDYDNPIDEEEGKSPKRFFKKDVENLEPKIANIVLVAQKFSIQLQSIVYQHNNTRLKTRIEDSLTYFEPLFNEISQDIYAIIHTASTLHGTKQVTNDLESLELLFFNALNRIKKCQKMLESLVEGKPFDRESLNVMTDQKARKALFLEKIASTKNQSIASKYAQMDLDSNEISYMMFREKLSIAEIAQERGLTEKTICQHLTHFVAEGDIDLLELVSEEICKEVLQAQEIAGTYKISEIKKHANNATYEQIRFVLAALENNMIF